MKALALFAVLSISQLASADEEVIRGHWYNDDYEFAMSKEWEDVHGSWGISRYDLVWDSYTTTLSGVTAGVYQELEFDDFNKYIIGESYCGWIDLKYQEAERVSLKGNFCMTDIDMNFASKTEMLDWVKKDILVRIVEDFPEPTREKIHDFLKQIVTPF